MDIEISEQEVENLYKKLKNDAESYGYNLNPDLDFTKGLIKGLIINEKRYGYQSCPCRLSTGNIEKDRDIICPCDYRDADINDYGACYCGLYVDEDIKNGKKKLKSIPERRNLNIDNKIDFNSKINQLKESFDKPSNGIPILQHENLPLFFSIFMKAVNDRKIYIWRCKVCGYLCARENPPQVCPICKVSKDRFERIL